MILGSICCPLLISALLLIVGKHLGGTGAMAVSCICHVLCALLGALSIYELTSAQTTSILPLGTWIRLPEATLYYELLLDQLSGHMVLIVEAILIAVLYYSISYLRTDSHLVRYAIYMNLFSASMIALLTSSGPIQLFVG